MDEIIPAFEISLLDPAFSAVSSLGEVGIDSILSEGVFRSIPIVGVVLGAAKTFHNLSDRNLLAQTLTFIKCFNAGTIDPHKLDEYKKKLEGDPKKAEAELGRVLIILNKTMEKKQSEFLAKAYRAYVNSHISWEQFVELSEAISRLFVLDIDLLYRVHNNLVSDTAQCANYQVDRLVSLGLLGTATRSMTIGNIGRANTHRYLSISEFGSLLCKITLNP